MQAKAVKNESSLTGVMLSTGEQYCKQPHHVSHAVMYFQFQSRFWILIVYSFVSFTRSFVTLQGDPLAMSQYYGLEPHAIEVMLQLEKVYMSWLGIVVFMVLATQNRGIRKCLKTGTALLFVGTAFRVLPTIFPDAFLYAEGGSETMTKLFLYLSNIFCGLAKPLILASVTKLALTWFSVSERPLATAVGLGSTSAGAACAFFVGPALVELPILLYLHIGFSTVALVVVCIFFPPSPPSPPSFAAANGRLSYLGSVLTSNPLSGFPQPGEDALRTQSTLLMRNDVSTPSDGILSSRDFRHHIYDAALLF